MSIIEDYNQIMKKAEKAAGGDRDILEYYLLRPVANCLLLLTRNCSFSPNLITSFSIIFSIFAGLCLFFSNQYPFILLGALFLNVSLLLDSFDGHYARYQEKTSEFGGWYDGVSDCIKYVILFLFLVIGAYYHLDFSKQLFIDKFALLTKYREIILFLGIWILGNLFIIYYVHVSRYHLSINPGNMVTLDSGRFYIGIESLLYTIMTIFFLSYQIYWLLIFLSVFLPGLWIVPFYRTYQCSKII